VSIAVGKEAALQHLVGRGPDARHEVGRVEGGKVVVGRVACPGYAITALRESAGPWTCHRTRGTRIHWT
jgi:hypothetical protein